MGKFLCEECDKIKDIRDEYSNDPKICNDCEEDLPNITGYCDLNCRLSGHCSGAC